MASTHRGTSGTKIAVGEPFIKFLETYQFTGRSEKSFVPNDVLHSLAAMWAKGLKSWDRKTDDDPKQPAKMRRDFVRLYGKDILRKLIIFALDTSGASVMDGFNEKNLEDILKATNLYIFLLDTQRNILDGMNQQIYMVIGENGEVATYKGAKDAKHN